MLKNGNQEPFPHRLRSFIAAMAMITVVLALALLATATRDVEAQASTRNADAKAAPLANAVEKIDSICAAILTHAK